MKFLTSRTIITSINAGLKTSDLKIAWQNFKGLIWCKSEVVGRSGELWCCQDLQFRNEYQCISSSLTPKHWVTELSYEMIFLGFYFKMYFFFCCSLQWDRHTHRLQKPKCGHISDTVALFLCLTQILYAQQLPVKWEWFRLSICCLRFM